jgi:carbamoyltransferase
MDFFDYCTGLRMTSRRFDALFGGPPRQPESPITQREMDIAASIQAVTEDVVLRLARTVRKETGMKHLCLAGGVALNCVANGRVLREGPFEDVWVQPAAGDAGAAVGAAAIAWYEREQGERFVNGRDAMQGSLLGPHFSTADVRAVLDGFAAIYEELDEHELIRRVAALLESGNVVGWFQGRMEFGPRALGSRSILGDPRNFRMQSTMNLKIKYRESFRPFAPAVVAEKAACYFEIDRPSPYMMFVTPLRKSLRLECSEQLHAAVGFDKLKVKRSELPAITHVDYSARVQTVHADTNSRFHRLLLEFERRTGCAVLVNTSFNVRGEPIVCLPADAYRCFMRTEMDVLVIGRLLLEKGKQSPWRETVDWKSTFDPD